MLTDPIELWFVIITTLDVYLWLKAFHVIAVLAFIGGLTTGALGLATVVEGKHSFALAGRIRQWDRVFTSPALLATWGFGIAAAASGDWFAQGWLQFKLVLVLLLSAFHGVQAGHLRRIAEGRGPPERTLAVPVLLCVATIAALAVVKPG